MCWCSNIRLSHWQHVVLILINNGMRQSLPGLILQPRYPRCYGSKEKHRADHDDDRFSRNQAPKPFKCFLKGTIYCLCDTAHTAGMRSSLHFARRCCRIKTICKCRQIGLTQLGGASLWVTRCDMVRTIPAFLQLQRSHIRNNACLHYRKCNSTFSDGCRRLLDQEGPAAAYTIG